MVSVSHCMTLLDTEIHWCCRCLCEPYIWHWLRVPETSGHDFQDANHRHSRCQWEGGGEQGDIAKLDHLQRSPGWLITSDCQQMSAVYNLLGIFKNRVLPQEETCWKLRILSNGVLHLWTKHDKRWHNHILTHPDSKESWDCLLSHIMDRAFSPPHAALQPSNHFEKVVKPQPPPQIMELLDTLWAQDDILFYMGFPEIGVPPVIIHL